MPGIDILLFQFSIMALPIIVELGKYDVPDFHIPVAVAAHCAARLSAAVFGAAVIINFGTGTAGTGTVLPEVILFAKFENTLGGNSDLLIPDTERFLIGRRRSFPSNTEGYSRSGSRPTPLWRGQKLPGPVNGLVLEIIAEGEVAQHFKICAVAGSIADIFDVARADALLAGAHTAAGRLLLPL